VGKEQRLVGSESG